MIPFQAHEGLSHHGEPDSEEEVIVLEEPERQTEGEPTVIRAPREPTHKYIEAHEATHLPHADWCEFCMAGRGRNKPHKKKPAADAPRPSQEEPVDDPTWSADAPDDVGASDGPSSEGAPSTEPVPRVCMGYFYVSSKYAGSIVGSQAMSTRELRNKLKELGKSTLRPRTS